MTISRNPRHVAAPRPRLRRRIRLRLDRAAGLLPGPEPALDMRDGLQAHAGRGLGRERRAPAARAEEHEALVLGEDRLVIGAVRIDPEFEQAPRRVEGARNAPFAPELARV